MPGTAAFACCAARCRAVISAGWIACVLGLGTMPGVAGEPGLYDDGLLLAARTMDRPLLEQRTESGEAADDRLLLVDRRGLHDGPVEEAWFESETIAGRQRRDAAFELPPASWQQMHASDAHLVSLPIRLPAEDFSELEAARPRFAVAGLVADEQRSIVGGRVLTNIAPSEEQMTVEARMSWLCEFLQNEVAATSFFAPGDKAVYAVQGLSYGNNWLILGCAWRWELSGGLSAFAGYDAQVNSQQMFHIGSTGLAFGW